MRGYVNENKELHRLEYWFLDWFDGASVQVSPGSDPWNRMQEMLDLEGAHDGYQSALAQ